MTENWLEGCVTGWIHSDRTACDVYLAPPRSAPPGGYWCTEHQMLVRHPASPIILEMSKYDPDEDPQEIAALYQAQLIPSSLPATPAPLAGEKESGNA